MRKLKASSRFVDKCRLECGWFTKAVDFIVKGVGAFYKGDICQTKRQWVHFMKKFGHKGHFGNFPYLK